MSFKAWICEGCHGHNRVPDDIWDCPQCGKETCEKCFDRYAHCKPCSKGKTDRELADAANAKGYDFETSLVG